MSVLNLNPENIGMETVDFSTIDFGKFEDIGTLFPSFQIHFTYFQILVVWLV
jgi:hypothetical protein